MAKSTSKLRPMLSQALDAATPTLRDWATQIDAKYQTVRAYRLGTRGAPPTVLRALATAFRRKARELDKLAQRLEREAERNS